MLTEQLLGVDIGTTHCKAGLFERNGTTLHIAHRPTPTKRAGNGSKYYDPEELWAAVAATIRECTLASCSEIVGVGVASMAETGLLLDRATGQPRTPVFPWFDRAAAPYADHIAQQAERFERFCATGQYPSFKSGLARLLWLQAQDRALIDGATWLGAADYVVYRLTGARATDPTLATRTYAFRIDQGVWDTDWLHHWKLPTDLFPQVLPSGTPAGSVSASVVSETGLQSGTPVAVAGHDHVCAALAAGVVEPQTSFDSMGTAETLIGALLPRPLGRRDYESGLTFGQHVVGGRLYWMGGLSAGGGSVEWLRALLSDPPLSYGDFLELVAAAGPAPTGILYLPYLLGSGAPQPDSLAQAALVGLHAGHDRTHIAKAVLEGVAYEWESLRRVAAGVVAVPLVAVIAAGGGTRNRSWMQIKADVSGCRIAVPSVREATLWGAALVAGLGCGVYADVDDVLHLLRRCETTTFAPEPAQHARYRAIYEQDYLALQQPLRAFYHRAARQGVEQQ